MAIKEYKKPDSIGLSVGMGFLTGGPAGAASALLAKKNPGLGALGSLMGGAAKGAAPSAPQGPQEAFVPETPSVEENLVQPEIGSKFETQAPSLTSDQPYDPLQKKFSLMQEDPKLLTSQALEMYKDPKIYATHDGETIVPQLLRFKHYGSKP